MSQLIQDLKSFIVEHHIILFYIFITLLFILIARCIGRLENKMEIFLKTVLVLSALVLFFWLLAYYKEGTGDDFAFRVFRFFYYTITGLQGFTGRLLPYFLFHMTSYEAAYKTKGVGAALVEVFGDFIIFCSQSLGSLLNINFDFGVLGYGAI